MTLARNLADLGNQVDSSGTLGIGGGGTSATNATAGFNALAPSQTSNTNKYLTTNGTNTSWADVVSGMTVTSLSYSGDDQAVDPSNPLPCTLTGTNFVAGSIVYVNTISAANSGTSINVTSSTSITFTPPTGLSPASYNVWIVSPTGTIAILANGILYSGAPSWAGQSTSLSSGASVSIQLTATGDTPMTYSLVSGTLPTGTTLSSSGLISGTATTAGTYPNIVIQATDVQHQDANVTIEITITLADAYFPYVTMLLHGDGANGAQNNTFVDSSSNNFTVTRNGNVTQGSFSPYSQNWSTYLNGSSYLRLPQNSAFTFGTNSFCVEMFAYFTATPNCHLLSLNNGMGTDSPSGYYYLAYEGGAFYSYGGAGGQGVGTAYTMPLNQWVHIVACRSGTTSSIFVNGTRIVSGTVNYSYTSGTIPTLGGGGPASGKITGYLSNVRIVNGSSPYDATASTITVPTTALTAVTNTALLTCQSNRFIDNSSNNFSITPDGYPTTLTFSPVAPTSAYSTATIGGSGYFDGSGDYLSTSFTSQAVINQSFTFECWAYVPAGHPEQAMMSVGTVGGGRIHMSMTTNNRIYCDDGNNGASQVISSANAFNNGCWNHFALVRNGTTFTFYVNGTSVASSGGVSGFYTDNSASAFIGAAWGTANFANAYICDAKITKSAVYTSNFTPSTSPTSASGSFICCNMTNAGIYDNAMMNNLETVGNAQISTSVVKYGTGSISFDGDGDYLVCDYPTNNLVSFGTGDFTVEFWAKIPQKANDYNQVILSTQSSMGSGTGWTISTENPSTQGYIKIFGPTNSVTGTSRINDDTWRHFAFCRSGSTMKIFVDGTSQVSTTFADDLGAYGNMRIGGALDSNSNRWFTGYIDDLRITKGYARYTANFTPPTAAFANQ